ncbi:hypothetical protein M3Y95_00990500 [Aphelenchoides besseyi]|nr:hypothetical protein M3Y95_00990500 [Aphelenchoides besseyi]
MLTPNSAISWTIDMSNGNLSEPKRNNLRDSIWPSMIADGKLFGFAVDQNLIVNPNKLCEVSMVDGTKIEHEIEEKENMEISYYSTPYLWTNGQLLVGIEQHNLCTVSAIFKFDIARMKWEKTGIEVDGKIESMIVNDGMLIVYAFSPKNGLKQIYRFQYETVDLLANLIWLSMRRYSQHNPRFQRWFLSQLPKTHKFRGLETSGERKH